ncbi:DgyrCDS823 [Dimorphilus gyrociliatus]|uniref:DgyrCDS823 n=1 Tax=Dimorphilus gyrociliatus TaxID=2664684 RepID=A0A7I8V703_9ANNE|nr:DgyrCDS823 [Dimorphilus gyrociliatus]
MSRFILTIISFHFILQLIHCLSIKRIQDNSKIITNEIQLADINIAVLSTVREQPSKNSCNVKNSAISSRFLQSLYLVKKGIDDVNRDDSFLPNITIGYVFIDTCNLVPKTIKHSVQLIPRVNDQTCSKSNQEMEYFDIQAVIASISSSESVQLSSLLSRFNIPQISPMSTSDDLSDKVRYEYFTRIVSPDRFQAEALTDFILEYHWNYVSILFIEGSYGENGAKQLRKLSSIKGICIAVDEMISLDNSIEDIEKAVKKISNHPNAEIIIIFLYPGETKMLYDQLEKAQLLNIKYVLASDGMSFIQIPSVLEKRVYNTFGIAFQYRNVPGSFEFLTTINPVRNPNLLYINDYWSRLFDCTWERNNNTSKKLCDPETNLTAANFQIAADSLEYDCFLVLIKAINRVIQRFCPGISRSKVRNCVTGQRLLKEIRTGSFNTTLGNIQFDKNGDVYGGYNLVQYTHNGKWNVVGRWSREKPGVEPLEKIIWPESYVPVSVCSKPCPPKHYFIQKAVVCCWDCRKCRNNEIVIDNRTGCEECPEFFWPDREALKCVAIEADYLKWSDFESVIILASGIVVEFIDNVFLSDEAKRWNLWSE